MNARLFLATALSLAAAGAFAAEPAPAPQAAAPAAAGNSDTVVAVVNGKKIKRAEIEAAQKTLPQQYQQLPIDAIYPSLLNRVIDSKLLQAEGNKKYAADKDFKKVVEKELAAAKEQIVANAYIQRQVAGMITDEDLRRRYNDYVQANAGVEEVKARHILVPAEQQAKDVIAELAKGTDFATLAKSKSTGPGQNNGGELGWFKKTDMVPEFADAAFELKPGEYTKTPVKTQFGWHVIQLEDRRKAQPAAFEEVKDQLREQAAQAAFGQLVGKLRTEAKIERFNLDGTPMAQKSAAPKEAPPKR